MNAGRINLAQSICRTRRRREPRWVEVVALVGMVVLFAVVGLATWWIVGG